MEIVKIRKALPSDHSIITQITMDGKAFWGYSKKQLSYWESDLTITAKYLSENETYKLILAEEIIGYYSFLNLGNGDLKLDYLFLFQNFIGRGFGQLLINDFLKRAKQLNTIDVILESDPNAETFYRKFGFETYNQRESSIKGRFLPQMKLDLIK